MNAKDRELKHFRDNHPELWNKLLSLENEENLVGPIWNTLTQTSLHDKEEQFYIMDNQINLFQENDLSLRKNVDKYK